MSKDQHASIAIPHVSFEAMKKVVLALYAFKKPGSAKELSGFIDLNTTNSSKALSVAKSLGFVKQTQRGIYVLTDIGKELARNAGFKKDDEVESIVKKALLVSVEWTEIMSFLRANVNKPRNPLDLVQLVESRMNKQWKPSMRNSLATMYKSILIAGGLIDPDEPKILSLLNIDGTEVGIPEKRLEMKTEMIRSHDSQEANVVVKISIKLNPPLGARSNQFDEFIQRFQEMLQSLGFKEI